MNVSQLITDTVLTRSARLPTFASPSVELGPRRFLTFYTRAPRLATRARRCFRLFPGPQKYSLLSRNPYEKDFLGPHNKSYLGARTARMRSARPGTP